MELEWDAALAGPRRGQPRVAIRGVVAELDLHSLDRPGGRVPDCHDEGMPGPECDRARTVWDRPAPVHHPDAAAGAVYRGFIGPRIPQRKPSMIAGDHRGRLPRAAISPGSSSMAASQSVRPPSDRAR